MTQEIPMQLQDVGTAPVLCASRFPGETPQRLTFQGIISEHQWALHELDPEFPADWSAYAYLVLELRNSSPQRFFVRVHTPHGMRVLRIQPVGQGVWYRAAIPLKYFMGKDQEGHDLASTINRPRNSFWMSVEGPFGTLDQVDALELAMEYPIGRPIIEVRLLGLAREDPGAEILEQLPVVDEFGQWRPGDWPGRIGSLAQLESEWKAEEERLARDAIRYTRYGGYPGTQAAATGFFRVEEIDGRWWFVDPEGHLFLSTGVNGMGTRHDTRTAGRESYYATIPPGTRPGMASFYGLNLRRRFGEDWEPRWAELTGRRMEAWGLNTTYVHGATALAPQPRKAYVVTVRDWQIGAGILGLPDVYADEFARHADEIAARDCAPRKDDPYLLGYFVGNEPPWPDRESELVDMILAGPPSATQSEARAFLARGDTLARRRDFVLCAFETYLKIINAAVRRHDPNHLNLGLRFGLEPPEDIIRMGRSFDVYSLNVYGVDPMRKMEHAYQITGRPTLLGEFHFGAPGRGLGAGLVQARDQHERGVAYRYYVEQAAACPSMIGAHWFQWLDQPVTGRMDGENYNIGFVDGTDRPHWDFVAGVQETHRRLLAVHSGQEPPTNVKARRQ
jgi:hypothetical protein